VLLGEIEIHEEGGPTVPADDDIGPMEEDMDHDMEEDDPLQYLNTGFENEVMMSQPYEYEMHSAPEQERPRECKKSLFTQSSQDMPLDAGSTQAQLISQGQGRSMLSPTTLGTGLREGLTDPPAPEPTKKKQRKRPTTRKGNIKLPMLVLAASRLRRTGLGTVYR
jgi:hypothetical protein